MAKAFLILVFFILMSMQAAADESLFCLGLVKASKEANFIAIVEPNSIIRDDKSEEYRYSVRVTDKIKSDLEEPISSFEWSDVRSYDISKKKLIFVFEEGLEVFDLEYFLNDGYVLVPRGGIAYFMISSETSYPSIPVYRPSLKNKEGEVANEISGHLIPLSMVVENLSTAISFDITKCRNK